MKRLCVTALALCGVGAAWGGSVRDFGAVGDGKADDTAAIQRAIDAGGAVTFPAGTYLTGSIYLKSDGGLDLAPGAVLLANPDLAKWPRRACLDLQKGWRNRPDYSGLHLICAVGVTNVFIRGGAIDGNVGAFMTGKEHVATGNRFHLSLRMDKPCQMVWFRDSSDIRVTDTAFRNSTMWNLFFHGCDTVFVRGLRIDSRGDVGEDDGIDIDCCSRVTVSDCIIDVGDDGITLRGDSAGLGRESPCEYVTVANCVVRSEYAHAIRVGVGSGTIRRCSFDNIVMNRTRGGIWVCNKYRSGRGVDISDVSFDNVQMDAVCGIFVRHDYKFVDPKDPFLGVTRNIRFSHVTGTSVLPTVQVPNGKAKMENVSFDGCELVCGAAEGADPGELKFFQFTSPSVRRREVAAALNDEDRFDDALEAALKDGDPLVRRYALNELVMRDPDEAVERAEKMKDDPAEEVQLFLLDISNLIEDKEDRTAFVEAVAAKSAFPEVVTSAERLLGFPFFRQNVALSKDPENDHDMVLIEKVELPKAGWRFTTDDARHGHRLDVPFFAPDFDDTKWSPIEIGRVWEEQGFGGYDGVGWYRLTFRLPAKPAEERSLELCFGAVDEDAWVWLNGKYVGQHVEGPAGYAVPFRFGADAEANWGGENQITVRVGDSCHAGGIWKGIDLEILK